MELIIKSNNENSIAKIIALARKLNVTVEEHNQTINDKEKKEDLKNSILNFKGGVISSFGDASEWQEKERQDRNLPFSK